MAYQFFFLRLELSDAQARLFVHVQLGLVHELDLEAVLLDLVVGRSVELIPARLPEPALVLDLLEVVDLHDQNLELVFLGEFSGQFVLIAALLGVRRWINYC